MQSADMGHAGCVMAAVLGGKTFSEKGVGPGRRDRETLTSEVPQGTSLGYPAGTGGLTNPRKGSVRRALKARIPPISFTSRAGPSPWS